MNPNPTHLRRARHALLAAVLLTATACGGSDGDSAEQPDTTTQATSPAEATNPPDTTEAPTTTAPAPDGPEPDGSWSDRPGSDRPGAHPTGGPGTGDHGQTGGPDHADDRDPSRDTDHTDSSTVAS